MPRWFPMLPIPTFLLLAAPTAHATCPASASDLAATVNASEAAFSAMNIDAFNHARGEAIGLVDCLDEQLPPANVASLHRMQAYAAFMAQDDPNAMASFQAALTLQPGYRLPSSIAPEGSPLQLLYAQATKAESSPTQALQPPTGASLYIDGLLAQDVPTQRPYLLQVLAVDGAVSWSGYQSAGASLPEQAIAAPDPVLLHPEPEPLPPAPERPIPVDGFPVGRTVAVGTSVAATAALGILALRSYNGWQTIYETCTTKTGGCSEGTLDNMQTEKEQAIGLGIGAGVVGALSIGLGVSLAF